MLQSSILPFVEVANHRNMARVRGQNCKISPFFSIDRNQMCIEFIVKVKMDSLFAC